MAEDATTNQPSPPPPPLAPAPAAAAGSVRVPGAEAPEPRKPAPAAVPPQPSRYDFGRFTPAQPPRTEPAAEPFRLEPKPQAAAPAEPVEPPPAPPAQPAPVEPPARQDPNAFDFDFGFGAPRAPAEPHAPAPSAAPAVDPEAAPAHDSIGDLIAAELFGDTRAEPSFADTPAVASPGTDARVDPEPRHEPAPTPSSARIEPAMGTQRPTPSAPTQTSPEWSAPPVSMPRAQTPPPAPANPPPREPELPSPAAAPVRGAPQSGGPGDPIRDIEDLIGRAARVDLETPPPRPAPSPTQRSYATPTLPPQPSSGKRVVSGADEAILAAAAATGAEVGWVDDPEPVEAAPRGRRAKPERAPKPEKAPKPPRARRVKAERPDRPARSFGLSRALVGPGVALVLLLLAGGGLYWVLGNGGDSGPAPLLTADATPVKEEPPPVDEAAAPQQSVIFNEIDGVVPGAEEQLVSRDQADVNEVTQVPPPAAPAPDGVVNRKVRTVTVRPDGTIVSGDNSVAGSAMLPVDRPNVPEVPGANPGEPSLLGSLGADTPSTLAPPAGAPNAPATPGAPPEAQAPAAPPVTPVVPGSTVPAVDAAGAPIPGKTAPVPLSRPNFAARPTAAAPAAAAPGATNLAPPAPTSPVNALVDPATAPQASATPPSRQVIEASAATPLSNAPAYVQLSSQRTEEAARQSALQIANQFGPLFKGANLEVQRVDLGERGIFYRVRVPANSTADANALCNSLKSAGGDCFTL